MAFSRKLMRITLSRMYQKRDELSVSMNDNRTELRRLCARSVQRELYNRIIHVIHILNSDWFQFLKEIKGHKLQKFNDNTSLETGHQEESETDAKRTITTISENLNLSEAEKSVLRKGLNFVPIKPTTDEFTTREDCEKFFRRLRLKAFFHNQDHQNDGPTNYPGAASDDREPDEPTSSPDDNQIFERLKPK